MKTSFTTSIGRRWTTRPFWRVIQKSSSTTSETMARSSWERSNGLFPSRSGNRLGIATRRSYSAGVARAQSGSQRVHRARLELEAQRTADVMQSRTAELGLSVSALVAELATPDSDPAVVESDEIAELDRRRKIEAGQPTGPT